MKKLACIALGLFLASPSYAWDGGPEDMNTMNDNMSSPVVRVVKSYPGMFRGWSDNNGFKYGYVPTQSYVETHTHVKPHKSKVRKHRKVRHAHNRRHRHNSVRQYRKSHHQASSGVCIAQCYCKHH